MSVNILCCHARNIQTAKMLTTYELTKIEESSSSMLPVTDPTSVVPSDGHVGLLATPSALVVDSIHSDSLAAGESVVSGNVPVSSCVFADDFNLKDNLLPLLSSSPVFQGDVAMLEMLIDQFKDLDQLNMANFPRLPRVQISKKLKEVITEVNYCVGLLALSCALSLEQCVKLLYAAGAVVTKLLPHQFHSPGSCSWQCRLDNRISQLRRDLSHVVILPSVVVIWAIFCDIYISVIILPVRLVS